MEGIETSWSFQSGPQICAPMLPNLWMVGVELLCHNAHRHTRKGRGQPHLSPLPEHSAAQGPERTQMHQGTKMASVGSHLTLVTIAGEANSSNCLG